MKPQRGSKILVFYALAREMKGLKRRLAARRRIASDGLSGFAGRLDSVELILLATGVGGMRARQCARRAFSVYRDAELALSCGLAGALSEGLSAGDLVLADHLLLGGKEDNFPDHILEPPRHQLEIAERALRGAGLTFATGALLTASRVLDGAVAKRAAKAQSGAVAVDMESAVIGLEAAAHGVPFVCVRAVFDEIDDPVPSGMTDDSGHVRASAAMGFVWKNPGFLLGVPRLVRNLSKAVRSIADAVEAIGRAASAGE